MTKKEKAKIICKILLNEYPNATCSLNFKSPLELLIATRLSAQCTDERVNIVSKPLFERFKDLNDFANCDILELEMIIKSCGFYHAKAKSIKEMCNTLLSNFGGTIPNSMEKLLTLSGVGRKTANLVLGELYNEPAIVADTHCIRLSNRLGLCNTTDPYKVELALFKLIKKEDSLAFCHSLVHHGRAVCNARKPICEKCCCKAYCLYTLKIDGGKI